MDLVRRHQPDPEVMMFFVVPGEEALQESPGILKASERLREGRMVFERLELRFGVRVVV